MGKAWRSFAAAVLLGFVTGASAGPVLWIDDQFNQLETVDVATGATASVGFMATDGFVTDIGFDPSGNLWAITFNSTWRVDASTAVATFVGPHGIAGGNALVFGADGTLYAAGNSTTNLYTINTSTGAGTSLGNMGFNSAGDLAFNDGQLYLSTSNDLLLRVNIAMPSASTVVGPLGVSQVFGLATGDDGILYATAGFAIYTVNTTTGAATFLRDWFGVPPFGPAFGTAFFSEAGAGSNGIPEPGTLTLIAAALLGLASCRKRRARMLSRAA